MNIDSSKNVIAASVDADGNVIVGDGNSITVINLKEAAQYKTLEHAIAALNERFLIAQERSAKYPDDTSFAVELMQIDGERKEKKDELENLRKEVLKLAEVFARIPINTERLQKAKLFFEEGKFAEARAVLDAAAMTTELDRLLETSEKIELIREANRQELHQKANEFMILARLTSTNYEDPDWFEKTKMYFGQSLKAEKSIAVEHDYAAFLQNNNQVEEAYAIYQSIIDTYSPEDNSIASYQLFILSNVLTNQALILSDRNEIDRAIEMQEKALELLRSVSDFSDNTLLRYEMGALNQLAHLQMQKNHFQEAEKNYETSIMLFGNRITETDDPVLRELIGLLFVNYGILFRKKNKPEAASEAYNTAIEILKDLAEEYPVYLDRYASALTNQATLLCHIQQSNEALLILTEALGITEKLAAQNPLKYLKDLAVIYNNLANIYAEIKYSEEAEKLYLEALRIRRSLVKIAPVYFSDLAMTLTNLGVTVGEQGRPVEAKTYYNEAIEIHRSQLTTASHLHLPGLANTLAGLGDILREENNIKAAEEKYTEAFKIRHRLVSESPDFYWLDFARSAANLALFYAIHQPDKKASLAFAADCISVIISLNSSLPEIEQLSGKVAYAVQHWGEDFDAFVAQVEEENRNTRKNVPD